MEDLVLLRTCDLGAEDESKVPEILKMIADQGANKGEGAWKYL